jgi:hypothetical protein
MGRSMGFSISGGDPSGWGEDINKTCFKRKYQWLFKLDGVISQGVNAIPPFRGARPSFSFKEMEVQHLNETIYFPSKAEYKPITLTLYDLKRNKHPVFEWIKKVYNPCNTGTWKPSTGGDSLKKSATLEIYSGCGDVLEKWKLDNCFPQTAEFGELDMSSSEVIMVDVTLRYDRAYLIDEC